MASVKTARSKELGRNVGSLSRSQVFKKRQLWKRKFAKTQKAAKPEAAEVTEKYYPAYDVQRPLASRAKKQRAPSVRPSLTPGTIVILLAGKYRGRRVVLLKSLKSGLLLVTGPYKINGVPMRRVNQAYVIATSTKIDISGVSVDEKLNDEYFRRPGSEKKSSKGDELFAKDTSGDKAISPERKADQKKIDAALTPIVAAVPQLKEYLRARFSLKNGQYPHEMQF